MREILFRGKRVDNGEWVFGDLLSNWTIPMIKLKDDGWEAEVIPETVGQFTGLLDKNGKKIFEGDLVKEIHYWETYEDNSCFDNSIINLGYVVFESGKWMVKDDVMSLYKWNLKTLEIIGNIYDPT